MRARPRSASRRAETPRRQKYEQQEAPTLWPSCFGKSDDSGEDLRSVSSVASQVPSPVTMRVRPRQQDSIPGYRGHIQGKVAENIHGGTFVHDNVAAAAQASQALPLSKGLSSRRPLRRPLSAPNLRQRSGLKVIPHVPGYTGFIPHKQAEAVHGLRYADANDVAHALDLNQQASRSNTWMRKGHWPSNKMDSHELFSRCAQQDAQRYFTPREDEVTCENNRRLGHTFGWLPPAPNVYRAGSRYLCTSGSQFHKHHTHVDASRMQAAGISNVSQYLDGLRWAKHHGVCISTKAGNPSFS